MKHTHNRLSSRVAALIAVAVIPVVAGACSQAAETPAASHQAFGEGIVSWSTVEKSMARQRAAQNPSAAAASEQATATATPKAAPTTLTVTTEKRPATTTASKPHDAVTSIPADRPTRKASREPKPVTQLIADTVASPITAPPVLALPAMPPMPAPLAPAPVAPMAVAAAPAVFTRIPVVDESRIYSKDDADVIPARLLTTQSAAGLASGLSDVNTMELVVSPSGRVEEVKLAAPPKRMTDMLLLSGAKMWRFAPALKDGQPVRYRTQVSWETTR